MNDRRRKLTAKQVTDMRLEHSKGSSLKELGKKYRVSIGQVWRIVNSLSWKTAPRLECPHCHKTIA